MAEAHHKKQQITTALTDVRIQVQNEVSRLQIESKPIKAHDAGPLVKLWGRFLAKLLAEKAKRLKASD